MNTDNRNDQWGLPSIVIHWLSAIVIVTLFALGLYMTSLTYYDRWYHLAPHVHKSIGVLLLLLTFIRIGWLLPRGRPLPVPGQSMLQTRLAVWTHRTMYLLIFSIVFSGYLISTAKGDAVQVFNWFSIESIFSGGEAQADLAGETHLVLAYVLITLAAGHTLAALKHHFLDKDNTLTRMLVIQRRNKP